MTAVLIDFAERELFDIIAMVLVMVLLESRLIGAKPPAYKALLCFLVLSAGIFISDIWIVPQEIMALYLKMPQYVGWYALMIVCSCYYCSCNGWTALFITNTAWCFQVAATQITEIIRGTPETISVLSEKLILILVYLSLFYFLFVFQKGFFGIESSNGIEKTDKKGRLAISTIILFVTVFGEFMMKLSISQVSQVDSLGNTVSMFQFLKSCYTTLLASLAFYLGVCQIREAESRQTAEMTRRLLTLAQERYKKEKDFVDAVNIQFHDIRHQIYQLGKSGYDRNLESLKQMVDTYDSRYDTGNIALNVVLSAKAIECMNQQIIFTGVKDGKSLSFMEETDIYALFGNILDNAIEAVERIKDKEKRQIILSVYSRNSFLYIEEENYYEGMIHMEDGVPQTTKENSCFHGYGIRSIRMLVDKYGGDMRLQAEDGRYDLSIMFPMQKQK